MTENTFARFTENWVTSFSNSIPEQIKLPLVIIGLAFMCIFAGVLFYVMIKEDMSYWKQLSKSQKVWLVTSYFLGFISLGIFSPISAKEMVEDKC